jgi:hypothetical protein
MGIPIHNDYNVIFEQPIDRLTSDPLDFTDDGSTASFKVYNTGKDSVLTLAVSSGTNIVVPDASIFAIGDSIEVMLDDSNMFDCGVIVSIDVATDIITVTNTFAALASIGRQVRVKLGATVTMNEFGTARIASVAYGFIGVMAWNHIGLIIGMNIEIRAIFLGTPPSALVRIMTICDVITDNCI